MTMHGSHVLLYTSLFPSEQSPTRGIFNLRGFEPLARIYDVGVVAPTPVWRTIASPRSWLSPRLECHNGLNASYPVYWVPPRVAHHMHAHWIYRSVRSHVLARHQSTPFAAIIGSFAYPDIVVAARLAADIGCPLVSLVLGSDINELASRPSLRPQIQSALSSSHLIVALTQPLRTKVLELGIPPEKVVVQHNGVDGSRFIIRDRDDARRQLNRSLAEKIVLFAGNLVPEKGPDVLLKAFQQLRLEPACNAEVVFIGDGHMAGDLRNDAEKRKVARHMTFLGRQSPAQVARWMAACDVLCLPSRREGCPNVVLEALACGRPVVASAVGGVPELVSEKNGVTVPADDHAALAVGLKAALNKSWDPVELRNSVESLSWESFSAVFHHAIATSLRAPAAPNGFTYVEHESRAL